MLCTLRNSVAVIAAAAALAGPVSAQTAAPVVTPAPEAAAPAATVPAATAPAATAPAAAPATTETPAAVALPVALTDLGITEATVQPGRKGGQKADGTLPGGTAFQAMLDDTGALRMIRVSDDAAVLPGDLVARLVPEAVRANAIFAEIANVKGVAQGDQGVMVFGTDTQNQQVRAGFAADGTLQKFGRGDMERGKDGKRGKGKDGKGKHGEGKHGKDKHGEGKRGEGKRGDRETRGAAPAQLPAELDDAAVARIVTDAGYTQPGAVTRNGPRLDVEAVNPNGEPVTLTVNPRGVIVREVAR